LFHPQDPRPVWYQVISPEQGLPEVQTVAGASVETGTGASAAVVVGTTATAGELDAGAGGATTGTRVVGGAAATADEVVGTGAGAMDKVDGVAMGTTEEGEAGWMNWTAEDALADAGVACTTLETVEVTWPGGTVMVVVTSTVSQTISTVVSQTMARFSWRALCLAWWLWGCAMAMLRRVETVAAMLAVFILANMARR